MSFTYEQKYQLDRLVAHRDQIMKSLAQIEYAIKIYFPEEFDIAYQHWIPQITTALYDDTKWLPRGEQTMQHTLNRLADRDKNQNISGLSKFL